MRHFIPMLMMTVLATRAGLAVEPAPPLKAKEVHELIANAKTPADHLRLAQHFKAQANRYAAEAKEHAAMAEMYSKHPTAGELKRPAGPDTAVHCRTIADDMQKAAEHAKALAAAHEQMARR